uniref:PHP domain n=1 Tax=Candidatus Kentrum sp. UNK TaxID=2126344 RepID=A0A451AQC5_9GAMM|nr:MAG: PHP domain [Candidatus Kentron sp. UNK]VFK73563.1 MAG: PHP domain [Candidatus Kentron sp. UNK]
MKKIDLHIHTVASSISDSTFDFSMNKLKDYVAGANLDAIAITNHNLFDGVQFRSIREALSIPVFPGIEIDLAKCHVLLISDGSNIDDFEAKTAKVAPKIKSQNDGISVDELESIFENLDDYLIIPHDDKKPAIRAETLAEIAPYVSAGEVDSAKKFIRLTKDDERLTPVLFSDARISEDLTRLPTRQTFIDCGELTLDAVKSCLRDKGKVHLSEKDGNRLFQIFDNGQMVSTGLNVLLGERSSGKTYTLNNINAGNENTKYIEQFSLVQQDEASYEREFKSDIERRRSRFTDDYLSGFKSVLDDVMNVDLDGNIKGVDQYISTLLKSAEEADRKDAYSKAALFNESLFSVSEDKTLDGLIDSVRKLIENVAYRDIIEKHIDISALKRLACELIETLWTKSLENEKKKYVNELIKDIKASLKMRSSAVQVDNVDLYRVAIETRKVARFKEIVEGLRGEAVISEESIQGFKVIAKKGPFANATEVKSASGTKAPLQDAMKKYRDPYGYLRALMSNESLSQSELYKLFTKITHEILNRDGFPVSGGERSEFRLLQEIQDAQNFDMLLIDEPESSFDNMFLRSSVNEILREISKSMPVVVVTHNSTVGASVGADYLLYARKQRVDSKVIYKIYSGHPTDKMLYSVDGDSIKNHEIMMNSLEAGKDTYKERRREYEALENRE